MKKAIIMTSFLLLIIPTFALSSSIGPTVIDNLINDLKNSCKVSEYLQNSECQAAARKFKMELNFSDDLIELYLKEAQEELRKDEIYKIKCSASNPYPRTSLSYLRMFEDKDFADLEKCKQEAEDIPTTDDLVRQCKCVNQTTIALKKLLLELAWKFSNNQH